MVIIGYTLILTIINIKNKKEVYPKDIENEPLILTETGCSYRASFENIMTDNNISINNVVGRFQFNSCENVKIDKFENYLKATHYTFFLFFFYREGGKKKKECASKSKGIRHFCRR